MLQCSDGWCQKVNIIRYFDKTYVWSMYNRSQVPYRRVREPSIRRVAWRPCLLSGKSPYKELLPTSCLVGPAPTRCRWSHRRAGQYAGKEPMWCSGSARCLPGVDSRTSPPPPASRDVFLILPCCQSYHDKYKCSYNYVSLLFSKEGDDGSANIAGFHILSHSFLRA